MRKFTREKKYFTVRTDKKIVRNVPKGTNLMDVLVKNNINFAYPFKVIFFPFLTTGFLKATQLPKLQSTIFCCGRLTGEFKRFPLYTCSQCLVEIKYANPPKKLNFVESIYMSNPILNKLTKNEVRMSCRTTVDDDMYVITYCDDAQSKGYIILIIISVLGAIAYMFYLYKYVAKEIKDSSSTGELSETDELLEHLTEKELEEWVKSKNEMNPSNTLKTAEDEISTTKINLEQQTTQSTIENGGK